MRRIGARFDGSLQRENGAWLPVPRRGKPGTITPCSWESVGDMLIPTLAAPGNGTWPAANRAVFIPFQIWAPQTVTQVAWNNGGTIANTNADVGVYDEGGTLLVSTGSTALSGANTIQVADVTDTFLKPGVYFMAMALGGAGAGSASMLRWTGILSIGLEMFGIMQQSTAFTLPSTFTLAVPSSGLFIPVMAMVLRATI